MDLLKIYRIPEESDDSMNLIISFADGKGNSQPAYPNQFYLRLLALDPSYEKLIETVQTTRSIVLLSGSLNFIWGAVPVLKGSKIDRIVIAGPISLGGYSEKRLYQFIMDSDFPADEKKQFFEYVKHIPVNTYQEFRRYIKIINYMSNGRALDGEYRYFITAGEMDEEEYRKIESWTREAWTQTNEEERFLMENLTSGKINQNMISSIIPEGGNYCPWNPLRQKKDEGIIALAFLTRAATAGGLNAEISGSVSDHYIQRIEAAESVAEVDELIYEARNELWRNVKRSIDIFKCSKPVSESCKYIRDHICDRLGADEIAVELDYNKYYLTALFKKETGMTMKDYIQREKIEVAQRMLRYSGSTLDAVSTKLNFGSKSYFIQVFKKIVGITPKKYQMNTIIETEQSFRP